MWKNIEGRRTGGGGEVRLGEEKRKKTVIQAFSSLLGWTVGRFNGNASPLLPLNTMITIKTSTSMVKSCAGTQ